jgi:hypothetical protein
MAMDFLTIQPMLAECERVFSATGKMVSSIRVRLDALVIGISQVLRSWYRAGVLPEIDIKLASIDVIDGDDDGEDFLYRDDRLATLELDSE